MHLFRFFTACTLGASLAIAGATEPAASAPRTRIVTPELTARWWQWAMYLPRDSNPVADTTGAFCAMGQRGDVWFLAGGFGSSKVRRTCAVPAGSSVVFPLINMVYWPSADGVDRFTCAQARDAAKLNNDTAIDLFAELDGRPLPRTSRQRVATVDCFDVFERMPAARKPYKAWPAATDGYWVWLDPLPPGRHVLTFGGRYNRSSGQEGRMVQDIAYELIVEWAAWACTKRSRSKGSGDVDMRILLR